MNLPMVQILYLMMDLYFEEVVRVVDEPVAQYQWFVLMTEHDGKIHQEYFVGSKWQFRSFYVFKWVFVFTWIKLFSWTEDKSLIASMLREK